MPQQVGGEAHMGPSWAARAREAMDAKAKPPGSLGRLEEWAVRLCQLQETLQPSVDRASLLVFAADHGVTKDNAVSAYPREVTPAVFAAIAAGKAACSVMAKALDCQVSLWDVGVAADVAHVTASAPHVSVVHYKIRDGTSDYMRCPAMDPSEVDHALAVGMVAVLAAVGDQSSCVRLPLERDESSPVPPCGGQSHGAGVLTYANRSAEDDSAGLSRQSPQHPDTARRVSRLSLTLSESLTLPPSPSPGPSSREGGAAPEGQTPIQGPPDPSFGASGSGAQNQTPEQGLSRGQATEEPAGPLATTPNAQAPRAGAGGLGYCPSRGAGGCEAPGAACGPYGEDGEGSGCVDGHVGAFFIDERSPPGVSQRCAHCGMPLRALNSDSRNTVSNNVNDMAALNSDSRNTIRNNVNDIAAAAVCSKTGAAWCETPVASNVDEYADPYASTREPGADLSETLADGATTASAAAATTSSGNPSSAADASKADAQGMALALSGAPKQHKTRAGTSFEGRVLDMTVYASPEGMQHAEAPPQLVGGASTDASSPHGTSSGNLEPTPRQVAGECGTLPAYVARRGAHPDAAYTNAVNADATLCPGVNPDVASSEVSATPQQLGGDPTRGELRATASGGGPPSVGIFLSPRAGGPLRQEGSGLPGAAGAAARSDGGRDDLPWIMYESRDENGGLSMTGGGPVGRGDVICVGEIGIGNTAAASAVFAALTGLTGEEVCGSGSGLDEDGVCRKAQAVAKALATNAKLIAEGPKGILQAVGGLEIAAMTGAYLACAQLGVPAVVDGFISSVAALTALRLEAAVGRVLFWSHRSAERAAGAVAAAAGDGATHVLDMGLRLGEGTGALLALPILRAAAAVMCEMATLEECLRLGAAP